INHEEKKVSLGIKQLFEDPWNYIPERYAVSTVLEVRVISVSDYESHVELERGVEGVIPRGEVSDDANVQPTQVMKAGDILKAEIIDLDEEDRRIIVSLRGADNKELDEKMKYVAERESMKRRVGPAGRQAATLGDLLKDKLGAIGNEEDGEG
ncbi:MAG: S1 RNA-binding domain-containing protein, partial [Planctomycetota bacterium]